MQIMTTHASNANRKGFSMSAQMACARDHKQACPKSTKSFFFVTDNLI